MAVPEVVRDVDLRPSVAGAAWRGRAYGVDIESSRPLASVGANECPPLSRSLQLSFVPSETVKRLFPRGAELLIQRAQVAGRPRIRVEHGASGFHIWSPGFGRYLISPDGKRVRAAVPFRAGSRWERLLVAQPLPLAAVLQGIELFHASAVRIDAGIIGFVASSGTGKTSVAAHLVADGAPLVTDDILAVEATAEGVIAHAGGSLLHLSDTEAAVLDASRRNDRFQLLHDRLDKLQFRAELSLAPAPLAGLYFLDRSSKFNRLVIQKLSPPSPKLLLSAAFLTYLRLPTRLMRQLELCAAVAATVPAFSVEIPHEFGAARLAEAIREHTGSRG